MSDVVAPGPRRTSWVVRLLTGALAFLLLFILLAVAIAGLGIMAYEAHYAARIYPGVTILGLPVGGLTQQQARALARRDLGEEALPYVALSTAERYWVVALRDLGGSLAVDEAVHDAWMLGRSGVFRADLLTQARLLWCGYDIVPVFHLEVGPATSYLRLIAREAGHPARRAQLVVSGLQARSGAADTGRELDIALTQKTIESTVQGRLGASAWLAKQLPAFLEPPTGSARFWLDPLPVHLVFREVIPLLTEVAGAQERVDLLLSAPLTLICSLPEFDATGQPRPIERRWSLDQATLASWLALRSVDTGSEGTTLEVSVGPDEVRAALQKVADEIARSPREARFGYDPKNNTLTTLTPGQNGYALDVAAAQALVIDASLSRQREITLPVRVVPPSVTRANLQALLPLDLLSVGESGFLGSTPERLQNIRVATARFDGLVVPARSTFSFLQNLGPVTVANGYSEAWIIYGNRTVLGPGGGVCQVSTTCFRAAFWAGLPIIERWPHSYRVSWYEPPVGLDAAVFSPQVDMKFQNDTDTPLLILTEVDTKNSKLYFRFYGKSAGRKVTLEGPTLGTPVPPGEPIVEEDATLSPGARVQVEWPHEGLDVTLYRIVEQNGSVVARDKLFSRYEPWPARYRVGPAAPVAPPP
jgi:vancomycin resistance protein YoaR